MVSGLKKRSGTKTIVVLGILIGLAIFVAANAHLVYVAATSAPDCVLATSDVGTTDTLYRPVKSGC